MAVFTTCIGYTKSYYKKLNLCYLIFNGLINTSLITN